MWPPGTCPERCSRRRAPGPPRNGMRQSRVFVRAASWSPATSSCSRRPVAHSGSGSRTRPTSPRSRPTSPSATTAVRAAARAHPSVEPGDRGRRAARAPLLVGRRRAGHGPVDRDQRHLRVLHEAARHPVVTIGPDEHGREHDQRARAARRPTFTATMTPKSRRSGSDDADNTATPEIAVRPETMNARPVRAAATSTAWRGSSPRRRSSTNLSRISDVNSVQAATTKRSAHRRHRTEGEAGEVREERRVLRPRSARARATTAIG